MRWSLTGEVSVRLGQAGPGLGDTPGHTTKSTVCTVSVISYLVLSSYIFHFLNLQSWRTRFTATFVKFLIEKFDNFG